MRRAVFDWMDTNDDPVDLTGAVVVGLPDDDDDESRVIVEKNGVQYVLSNNDSYEPMMVERNPSDEVGGTR